MTHPFQINNATFIGASGRESVFDLRIPSNWNGTLIVFIHGFMGFKDWGSWHRAGLFFEANSYGFLSYNNSHNGGTVEEPIDFPDTAAFSKNTYSKELEDFECVLDAALQHFSAPPNIYVIGHSRGGGTAALQSQHPLVQKWVSWAGISSIADRFPTGEALENWKIEGYKYVKNGRTKQELPLHFDQYLDYKANEERLDIEAYCKSNTKPCLILHGTEDTSVLPIEAERLAQWTNTRPVFIENAQHTFNTSHPETTTELSHALMEVCEHTLNFFNHE